MPASFHLKEIKHYTTTTNSFNGPLSRTTQVNQ